MRRILLRSFIFFVAISISLASLPIRDAYSTTECSDIYTIFARGSGSVANSSSDYLAFRSALSSTLEQRAPLISNRFYDLGSDTSKQDYYLDVSIEDPTVILGATFDLDGKSATFAQSVQTGITELTQLIQSTLATCPQTKFVIAGYSQGAEVVSNALLKNILTADQLIYAATFGDPKLFLPEGHKNNPLDTPKACFGKDYSSYRVKVPDCETEHGILGGYNPYILEQYQGKIGTWCNEADPICGSYFDFQHALTHNASYEGGDSNIFTNLLYSHLAYNSDLSYQEASNLIVDQILHYFSNTNPSQTTPHPVTATQDTAFLIDSTGSMSGLINDYKTEALNLAQQIVNRGGRIALYEYRDLSDSFTPVQHCNFSCDLATFSAKLDSITTDGGNDEPESALSASLYVMDTLDWRFGATKSLVILTDSGFHNPDHDGTTQSQVVQRSLTIDPVNFYIVTPDPTPYTELAEQTGGRTFNSAGEIELSTDYIIDRPIAQLSSSHYSGITNTPITFDASMSTATPPTTIDHYDWDLNFDNIFDKTTTSPTISQTYTMPTSGTIQVKITDTLGRSSTITAQLTIHQNDSSQPELTNLKTANNANSAQITFNKSDDTYLTLVLINSQIAGFIDSETLTLNSLPAEETDVTLIPVSKLGRRGPSQKASISSQVSSTQSYVTSDHTRTSNNNPSAQSPIPTHNTNLPAIPRTPNSGAH